MDAKKAINREHAWTVEEKLSDVPHGWIQWKGTDVCMDVHCKCGALLHVDGYFAYSVKCPHCETVYHCNGHIQLIELEQEPDTCVLIAAVIYNRDSKMLADYSN